MPLLIRVGSWMTYSLCWFQLDVFVYQVKFMTDASSMNCLSMSLSNSCIYALRFNVLFFGDFGSAVTRFLSVVLLGEPRSHLVFGICSRSDIYLHKNNPLHCCKIHTHFACCLIWILILHCLAFPGCEISLVTHWPCLWVSQA